MQCARKHAPLRACAHASLGMATAVRTHAAPIHAACGGGAPSGLKEGARVVGIAASAFAVTQTPIVCTSVSKKGRPSASCGRPCTHEVVHVVGTAVCAPSDRGVPRAPVAAAPRANGRLRHYRVLTGNSRGTMGRSRGTVGSSRGTIGAHKYRAAARKEALDAAHGWMRAASLAARRAVPEHSSCAP